MAAETDKRPGCLAAVLSLFRSKKSNQPEALPYRLRDDFLSPAEYSFYRMLSSSVNPRFTVLTKVRLADIFFVARPNENYSYFNRITQRHVDFLLCNPTTMKPVAGIELDDASHSQSKRQRRDEFVDQVFSAAGLPLVHIPARREYNSQEITGQLSDLLDVEPSAPPPSARSEKQSSSIPLCSKCGVPMVLKTARHGNHEGQQFYGCPNYPRCREVLPLK